ncbi:DUF1080 domain-containing protein [Roseiconus nitratireducens]|uniref:DUF1080 domain-containing protein n=2 Tax=Roseiconus nitratireducens TaxID=2605748 RepID=A0A5M6DIK4_9BACT|nr:DUF1080 domain-containing protein [Roseiconus nitratireducens]
MLLDVNTALGQDQPPESSSPEGSWAFTLPDGNPAWLNLQQSQGDWQGELLWSVGSARPVNAIEVHDGHVRFRRNLSWRPGGGEVVKRVAGPFHGQIFNDKLHLQVDQSEAESESSREETLKLVGDRIPPPPAKPDLSQVTFGKAIDLFNGKDLEGWTLSRPDKINGWHVEDGCLVNETPKQDFSAYGAYGNLMTTQHFDDFSLSIDYNVPAGGNSGIYLRGMYEAQVVDRDSPMQGIQGPGAIFGRLAPSANAGKPGGQWNTYVLTLVDRHITVVLNGQTVIDNQLLVGCTGGGLQANDALPGPILLQGDHTSVRYRNLQLRPVTDREAPGQDDGPNPR